MKTGLQFHFFSHGARTPSPKARKGQSVCAANYIMAGLAISAKHSRFLSPLYIGGVFQSSRYCHTLHNLSGIRECRGESSPLSYGFCVITRRTSPSPTSCRRPIIIHTVLRAGDMLPARTMKKREPTTSKEADFHAPFPELSNGGIFIPRQETGAVYNDISRETAAFKRLAFATSPNVPCAPLPKIPKIWAFPKSNFIFSKSNFTIPLRSGISRGTKKGAEIPPLFISDPTICRSRPGLSTVAGFSG